MKPGYKQTEVGVIPKDWNLDCIENIAHITTGSKNTQDRINDGRYPFFVRSQTVERINSYSFDGEAVLTAGDGVGTGKVFHYINGKFDAHQRVYRISDFSERINGFYFFLYFSTHFYNRIMQMTAKSSVDSVRREMISRMLVPLPPTVEEQRAIAEALSDVDGVLGALDRLIAKKRDLKQAAMQQLLTGQTRLPGFEGEWKTKRLGDVAEVVGGGTPSTSVPEYWNGDLDWFTPTELNGVKYSVSSTRKITCAGLANSSAKKLPAKTILMTTRASIGDLMILTAEATTNQGFQSLIIKENTDNEFIYYVMMTKKNELLKNASGSTFLEISPNKVKSVELNLPSAAEQTAIAEVLSAMDEELAGLEQRRDKTRALKQGMMQELLTGKTRLV